MPLEEGEISVQSNFLMEVISGSRNIITDEKLSFKIYADTRVGPDTEYPADF